MDGASHVVLCGAGHNIRLLMKRLPFLWLEIMESLGAEMAGKTGGDINLPSLIHAYSVKNNKFLPILLLII
jgi:hypothetical protein